MTQSVGLTAITVGSIFLVSRICGGFTDIVASFIMGIILQFGGYDGALEVQPQTALTAIQFCYAALPAILGIIGIISIWFYHPTLEKEKVS